MHKLHRFALLTFTAPVAFGLCAFTAFLMWVIFSGVILKHPIAAVGGMNGIYEVLFSFTVPGIVGSCKAVSVVSRRYCS